MRVLFMVRPDLCRVIAGDTIQILKTKEELEKMGIEVFLNRNMDVPGGQFDLAHIFNLSRPRETKLQLKAAKEAGLLVALSPIYWNREKYLQLEKPHLLSRWEKEQELRAKILEKVDFLLPNGKGEFELIQSDFKVKLPGRIIPNGINCFPDVKKEEFKYLLMVARFSRRKNQLSLLRAIEELDLPLILAGPVNDPGYLNVCRREAGSQTRFLWAQTPGELNKLYSECAVHVLPSYFETPGLATLEAAGMGCKIVSTREGTAEEYLGAEAFYCDPCDVESIREAVLKAWSDPPSSLLKEKVRREFNWQRAAFETREAYKELLGRN